MKQPRHAQVELWVHLVWTTVRRAARLDDSFWRTAAEVVGDADYSREFTVRAVGGYADHVHVLLQLRPDATVAKTVRRLKAYWAHGLRKRGQPDFAWQAGYHASSVSPDRVDAVLRYIRNQGAHHGREDRPG